MGYGEYESRLDRVTNGREIRERKMNECHQIDSKYTTTYMWVIEFQSQSKSNWMLYPSRQRSYGLSLLRILAG
jgi:hypothetical protein